MVPNPDGAFTVNSLPPAFYKVGIKGSHWLRKVIAADASGGDVSGLTASLRTGDVNNDNHVDILDLGLLADHYNSDAGDEVYDPQEDFNGDGHIDILDLGILADFYNTDGDP